MIKSVRIGGGNLRQPVGVQELKEEKLLTFFLSILSAGDSLASRLHRSLKTVYGLIFHFFGQKIKKNQNKLDLFSFFVFFFLQSLKCCWCKLKGKSLKRVSKPAKPPFSNKIQSEQVWPFTSCQLNFKDLEFWMSTRTNFFLKLKEKTLRRDNKLDQNVKFCSNCWKYSHMWIFSFV